MEMLLVYTTRSIIEGSRRCPGEERQLHKHKLEQLSALKKIPYDIEASNAHDCRVFPAEKTNMNRLNPVGIP